MLNSESHHGFYLHVTYLHIHTHTDLREEHWGSQFQDDGDFATPQDEHLHLLTLIWTTETN